MVNLMLKEDVRRLRGDYRRRLFVFGASLLFAVGIMMLIILASFWLFVRWHNWRLSFSELPHLSPADDAATTQRLAELVAWETRAKQLQASSPPPTAAWAVLARISRLKPSAVVVSHLDWEAEAAGGARLAMRGRATSRADLLDFVDRLEAENYFDSVESPISNLIKDRDLDFSLALIIKAGAAPADEGYAEQ